jgi:succinylglutamate desuccinylase/aspartoacylase family protein
MAAVIGTWEFRANHDIGETPEEFLRILRRPTWIRVAGRDRRRTRALTTLLHGNEPSGTRALHRFLKENHEPATNVVALVASVGAALEPPGFVHRTCPGRRDLNRCFSAPYPDAEGELARAIVQELRAARPEALVDLHNTSGSGPAYGVATRLDPVRLSVAARFTDRFVLTDIRLGALMEATEDDFPTVTIECGGARSAAADLIAFEGLSRYFCDDELLEPADAARPMTVVEHPVRIRLASGASLAYADSPVAGRGLTLRKDIDRFNTIALPASVPIGWTQALDVLVALDSRGIERRHEMFAVRGGRLHATEPLQLFMATTNERIAADDCLFYAIRCPSQGTREVQ